MPIVTPGGVFGRSTRIIRRCPVTTTTIAGPAWTNGLLPPLLVDRWGAVSIPAQPQGDGATLGDPALSRTLAFLYAYLVTDGNANAPWCARFGQPLILSPLSLFPNAPGDPLNGTFNDSYLPALFLWRADGGVFEQKADDYLLDNSVWTLLWVMPMGSQENQGARAPYVNQVAKAITDGLNYARTPSYVIQGDPDPYAAELGSFLWNAPLNCCMQYVQKWRPAKVVIEMATKGSPPRAYKAMEMKIAMVERLHASVDRYATRGVGLDARILNQYGQTTGRVITS